MASIITLKEEREKIRKTGYSGAKSSSLGYHRYSTLLCTSVKDEIEVEGKVIEALPNAMFKVEIDEKHEVLATLSGRIRMNFVRIVPGDKVKVVLSPYDLTRGRITWRVKS